MAQAAVQQSEIATSLRREDWDRDGYALVKGALPQNLLQKFEAQLAELWRNPGTCQIEVEGVGITSLAAAKTLDLSHHPSAKAITQHPSIIQALVALFARKPAFCQSLTFEYPSEQPPVLPMFRIL